METAILSYVIVSSIKNNIPMIIPKPWIVNKETRNPAIGNSYEWYWPIKNGNKKAEKYIELDKTWNKDYGQILDITGNLIWY